MPTPRKRAVLKVPYKSGWILVSNDTLKIKAHTKSFSEIVVKSQKLNPQKHFIMAAADSYQNYLMAILKTKTRK